ncbi:cylicin-1-like [Paramacrobiotus metropolitanus]|uniref:cylicin-1-like n=1 Tax=Paramacrobiotus metropolitanus TaxID=2943436 RepID=UPI0024465ADF|nr:cylicin-1-like [Paramacrobiotus metropolitanus]
MADSKLKTEPVTKSPSSTNLGITPAGKPGDAPVSKENLAAAKVTLNSGADAQLKNTAGAQNPAAVKSNETAGTKPEEKKEDKKPADKKDADKKDEKKGEKKDEKKDDKKDDKKK